MDATQNYANHRRIVPMYHFGLLGILVLNLLHAAVAMVRQLSLTSLLGVLVAAALIYFCLAARLMALTAQDRVIRLEERLRLQRLLPDPLRARIEELSPAQLIALRFASDGELPALVSRVLDEKIADRDGVKKLIREWRPDHLRV